MCGIIAVISKRKMGMWHADLKIVEQLLWADQIRGRDGTGIFFDTKKGGVKVRKMAADATTFLNHVNWKATSASIVQEASFVVGHNRWATKGNLTFENTHPFQEGNITLIHNGTLYYHKTLADVEVDSHAICITINKLGAEEALKKLDGAFALIWHNQKEQTISVVRNKDRPLFRIETEDATIFCSEAEMGKWVLSRNNIKVVSCESIPINTLFTYNIKEQTWTEKVVEVFKWASVGGGYKGSYDYEKYDTWNIPQHLPQKKNTNIVPIKNNNPYPHQTTTFQLGAMLEFTPHSIIETTKQTYLEGWTDCGTEVRWYTKDQKLLDDLLNEDSLIAKIVSECYIPAQRDIYLVVRDPVPGVMSANNVSLPHGLIKGFPTECHSCKSHLEKSNKEMRKSTIIWNNKIGRYSVFCPACSNWIEEATGDERKKRLAIMNI